MGRWQSLPWRVASGKATWGRLLHRTGSIKSATTQDKERKVAAWQEAGMARRNHRGRIELNAPQIPRNQYQKRRY